MSVATEFDLGSHSGGLRRKFLSNSGSMLLGNLIAQPLLLLATLLWARLLGPAQFGVYSFAFTLATLGGLVAGLGTDNILVREMSLHGHHKSALLGAALWLRCAAAVVVAAALVELTFAIGYAEPFRRATVYAAPYVLAVTLWYLEEAFFKSSLELRVAAQVRVAARLLLLAGIAGLWLLPRAMSCADALLVTAAAQLLPLSMVLPAILRRARPRFRAAGEFCRLLLREGWPLALSDVLVVLFVRLDVLFLSRMSSASSVGEYYAAARLAEGLGAVALASQATALPLLSQAFSRRDTAAFAHVCQIALELPMLAIVPACLVVTAVAGDLLRLLYGPAYAAAAPALKVLFWGAFGGLGYVLATTLLIAASRQRTCVLLSLLALATTAGLSPWLIPHWGALGAAMASAAALASNLVWMLTRPAWRPLLAAMLRALRVPGLAALPMLGVLLGVPAAWYVRVTGGLLLYAAGVYLLRHWVHGQPPELSGLFPVPTPGTPS
ncbi:MAG: oligosaccharide flippase family protein [Terriglobales bacterium]